MNGVYEGFSRIDFVLEGYEAILIRPKIPLPGNPWVWRAEFFGAFDYADEALLKAGWHIAYYRISDQYGSPKAVELMKGFHDHLCATYGLSPQADLFGFSRGGLYASNYAASYPEEVSVLYLDAPVLDIRCWPGGKGRLPRWEKEWEECKSCYGLTEEEAMEYARNPLDRVGELLAGKIPILLVAGLADEAVAYEENAGRLVEMYRENGGEIQVILKENGKHHPHSLENPEEITRWIFMHRK